MKTKNIKTASLLLVCLLLSQSLLAAVPGNAIGKAIFVHGAVSAQDGKGTARLLGKEAPVYEQERISTGTKSFTVLELNDGSRITLRPDTEFVIDEYDWRDGKASPGKANYSLLKGGIRALTGKIGKRNPRASTVTTSYATMEVRGTEYDARLCSDDCEKEMKMLPANKKVSLKAVVIGRVALIKAGAKAKDTGGKVRLLDKGGPVYLGDTLITTDKSFVVVIFRDDTRLTLRPSSEVILKDYLISQNAKEGSRYLTELLKGGLRTLTGNIGKQNPDGFKVKTSTSTMGIRGTGFDVFYKNPTWVHVWSGAIDFTYKDGAIVIGRCEGPSGGAPSIPAVGRCKVAEYQGSGHPRYLKEVPLILRWAEETRPDNEKFDGLYLSLFEEVDHDYSRPGLYVTVYDGHVRVNKVDVGTNESLFSDGSETYRPKKMNTFQLNDQFPRAGEVDERFAELYGLFARTGSGGGGNSCEVQ